MKPSVSETKIVDPANTSRRGFRKYDTNPSVPLHLDASRKNRRIEGVDGNFMVIADGMTGEIAAESKHVGFYTVDYADKEKFVKLFVNGVKAFSGLSAAGIKVFEVLYREVQDRANTDTVTINYEAATKALKMARATFFRGVKELMLREFIYESRIPYQYFININYLFNGNRLAFVKEFRLKEQKKKHTETVLPGLEEYLKNHPAPPIQEQTPAL
jgi:hypothetical protein